jgi:protein-arginine kinase activator protein McsA
MDSATPLSESVPSVQSAPVTLENMLEDAIKKEDYELANKLKDVIAYQDKNKKEDK